MVNKKNLVRFKQRSEKMRKKTLETAVLFLIFNRLEITKQSFQTIRKARPSRLYIASDGPRSTHTGEAEKVNAVRDYVLSGIDWDCKISTLFREKNLGCKRAVESAITWLFKNEEMGIVLEDDCVPDISFFQFCQELLTHYRYDTRIMAISGDNFQFGNKRTNYSYYFSRYPHCWGWATWRRAWKFYDVNMNLWPEIRDGNWLKDVCLNTAEEHYKKNIFQKAYDDLIDTWDYQWGFACWIQSGLIILPQVNLVKNIGFSEEGTHTISPDSPFAEISVETVNFPLKHPPFVIRDTISDAITWRRMFSLPSRLRRKARSILGI